MIRTLQPGQRCEVWIASATGASELAFATDEILLEAPNWTLDGQALILNGHGALWRLDLSGGLEKVAITGIPDLNNDHVLAPDGSTIYLSANDGHIYRADLDGGEADRLTADDGWFHFLHGVSPDGQTLAYVGIEAGDFTQPGRLITMPAAGGPSALLDTGPGHCDGPEYSPDGEWLYFNTEAFTDRPGRAQLARVRTSGGKPEHLLESDTVDWFPHLSPDGRLASYIRFPGGTEGHPADLPVDVVVVSTSDWATPLHTWPLFGGQGTLNVNSWSPDSERFAYVAYPVSTSIGTP
ncbi:TolB family protein [Arthrobacter bambusae]|uniref:TolB family protein n=1 Tax=Arthrobacter bambusae TaxID=1338426 RepID=UPI002782FBD6|nr:biopolymer transporter Tol [Arthrobacter bambusae]MDQ0209454.1 Tol biopolymer transport system component [Arthrobacter bambusae]MDQ0234220.1 Tol biopolymer transport system component [Arthrobacter bambusae]